MKNKKNILIFIGVILTFSIIAVVLLKNNSYAIDEEIINKTIKTIYNEDTLDKDIYTIVDNISSSLIPNTMYNNSNVLTENYDFLTIFAIDYIIKNEELYKDKIITSKDYTYKYYDIAYTTNKYITKDEIYNITDIYFNKKYYYITNEYLNVTNDYVPLLLLKNTNVEFIIDNINIEKENNIITAKVKYQDNPIIYNFIFNIEDNYIYLYNVVLED